MALMESVSAAAASDGSFVLVLPESEQGVVQDVWVQPRFPLLPFGLSQLELAWHAEPV